MSDVYIISTTFFFIYVCAGAGLPDKSCVVSYLIIHGFRLFFFQFFIAVELREGMKRLNLIDLASLRFMIFVYREES